MSKGNMEIRKSTREDIKQIMAIFTTAKEYMAAHGNKTQWGDCLLYTSDAADE